MDQLNQKLLFSIPDPTFSCPNVKEKIAVWLLETNCCHVVSWKTKLLAYVLTASIDSICSNLKAPARPINAKHMLRLLIRSVRISASKII